MDNPSEKSEITSAVKDLAEATSTQAQTANKTWLLLMAVALIVLFPPETSSIDLPFELGKVNGADFYPAIFVVFSVLIVAFAAAYAQALRAHDLAHDVLDTIKSHAVLDIHVKDLFDILQKPSLNRVAPLAQLLGGKNHYHGRIDKCPAWRRNLTRITYILLKLISAVVFWILPLWAFWLAFNKAQGGRIPEFVLVVVLIIAAAASLVVSFRDLIGIVHTFNALSPRTSK